MRVRFALTWRGVEVRGIFDARPLGNRRDRVWLRAEVPLFADGDTMHVVWLGPLEMAPSPVELSELAEVWLDEAAEDRGLHPDDIRRRQMSLF